ncbi:hypothetical protein [Nocardia sp. NPDC005745]|uniref:hypothetical protein n=1 Tax=Nocardia sp. NPDC005745 TaxID=3157061 RepID=UPI0034091F14
MAVIWVGEFMVKVVAVLPNRTVVGPVNPVPVMVTLVPPVVGPDVGVMDVMVGMAQPPVAVVVLVALHRIGARLDWRPAVSINAPGPVAGQRIFDLF